jgi:molybdate transport system ATP-binding protein
VAIDSGGTVLSSDRASGRVAATVYPWEIELEEPTADHAGSARNSLAGTVTSLWEVGGRVRVGVDAGQAVLAEVTAESARRLGLGPGVPVRATWKATATRLVPR